MYASVFMLKLLLPLLKDVIAYPTVDPKNTTVFVGSNVTLECKLNQTHVDTDEVCWRFLPAFHGGEEKFVFCFGDIYEEFRRQHNVYSVSRIRHQLFIHNISLNNSGYYTCFEEDERDVGVVYVRDMTPTGTILTEVTVSNEDVTPNGPHKTSIIVGITLPTIVILGVIAIRLYRKHRKASDCRAQDKQTGVTSPSISKP